MIRDILGHPSNSCPECGTGFNLLDDNKAVGGDN